MRSGSVKQRVLRAFHSLGIDVRRVASAPSLIDFLHSRKIDTLYDVGANIGQFATRIRAFGYAGDILSFEPIASVYAKLAHRAAGDGRWQTRNIALGDVARTAEIRVSEDTVFSSLRDATPLAGRFDKRSHVERREQIQIETFDAVASGIAGQRAFLKIDTQGFERQVLDGAANALRHLLGVQLELPIEHLYDATWTLPEAIVHMERLGFTLAQAHPTNTLPYDRASVVELDCIFRRTAGLA